MRNYVANGNHLIFTGGSLVSIEFLNRCPCNCVNTQFHVHLCRFIHVHVIYMYICVRMNMCVFSYV